MDTNEDISVGIKSLGDRIMSLENQVKDVKDQTLKNCGKLDILQSDITGMKSDITGMKSDITGMKSDITGMKSDITGMKSDITGMKSDITDMDSDITEIKDKILPGLSGIMKGYGDNHEALSERVDKLENQ